MAGDKLSPDFALPREIVQDATRKAIYEMGRSGATVMTERTMNEILRFIYPDLIKWANRPPVARRREGDYNRKNT